jgi:hypothetical protein
MLCALLAPWAMPGLADAALRVVSSNASEVVVQFSGAELEWQTVGGREASFRRPLIPGGMYLENAGDPDLPSLIHWVAIPAGATPVAAVVSVDVDETAVSDLAPAAQERALTGESGQIRIVSERIRESRSGVLPAAWAEISGISHVRGRRMARLVVHPMRFDFSRGILQHAASLVVRVEWNAPALDEPRATRKESPDWEKALDSTLLNPKEGRTFPASVPPQSARGSTDSFASAPTWLKVKVRQSGIYQVDYFAFSNLGFDPASINPKTVRVFSGRFAPLAEDLNVPRDSFMLEHALLDLTDGDDVFEPTDRLLFHALGPHGWAAEYDSTLSRTQHLENAYTDETVVWITWGGSFSAPPRRMSTRSARPDTSASSFAQTGPARAHFEENNVDNFRYRDEDGWFWESLRGRGGNRQYDLTLEGVHDGTGTVTARVASFDGTVAGRHVQLKVGGIGAGNVVADSTWSHNSQSAVVDLSGPTTLLRTGRNSIFVDVITDANSNDLIYVAWFDIEYERSFQANGGRSLHFFSDPSLSLPNYLLSGFDATGDEIFLFDVTDPHNTVRLVDMTVSLIDPPHGLRFSDPTSSTAVRWYWATTLEGVLALPQPEVAQIRGLRSPANGGEYLVIYHPRFQSGAERLAELRRSLPSRPRIAAAVDIFSVYDEFSWGMPDPTAIRDFLKYAWEHWQQGSPLYVTLIGDAAYDTKRFLSGSPENLLPTYHGRYREISTAIAPLENTNFYATDDFFGYLEVEDFSPLFEPGLDIAIGRYPIATTSDLDVMLDKLDSYLREEQPGQWQNRIILVADDERTLDEEARETLHTDQVETLARTFVPPSVDAVKIYLTEFPRNAFGKKPDAQAKFLEEFSRGALMASYTGHGDQNTLSQEEVFVAQKVSELTNENKLPVFSTFSCTVSRFDLLSGSSICELFLALRGGGAVTTFASGALVFPNPSATLNQKWIGTMFGTPYTVDTFTRDVLPLGLAAMIAKNITAPDANDDAIRKNNEKYVILGDPALEVRYGKSNVRFERATVDSQTTEGLLRVIRGSVLDTQGQVLDGTNGAPPFRGTAFVHVTENADTSGYAFEYANSIPDTIPYKLDGPTAFRGDVPIENGRFTAKFYLSEAVPAGNRGRVSVFALEEGQSRHGSGAFDSLRIAPTISRDQVDDSQGPAIQIRFEGHAGGADGAVLSTERPVMLVDLEDPSGINLRPFPQFARLEGEMDGRDRIGLGEDFTYLGGSYTQGLVRRVLSFTPGPHTVEVKAFDNVGNRSSVKVQFTITGQGSGFDLVDAAIAPYPNPFMDECDFVYRLTHDADVSLKIYTVTGRRIFEDNSISGRVGDNHYHWSGLDEGGGPLANGTYLFRLKATVQSGAQEGTSDEFVGRVVKMR